MNLDPRAFPENVKQALADETLKPALARLKTHFQLGRRYSSARYGDFEALRDAGRAIRGGGVSRGGRLDGRKQPQREAAGRDARPLPSARARLCAHAG